MSQSLVDPEFLAPTRPDLVDIHPEDLPDASLLYESNTTESEGVYNVPIAMTENSAQVYGHGSRYWKDRYRRYAREGQHHIIGPMPPRVFLDTFCPCPAQLMQDMPPTVDAFKDVPLQGTEAEIYGPLIKALNAVHGGVSRCPGYTFRDTSKHPDNNGEAKVKPDVICYANVHLDRVKVKKAGSEHLSHADMGFAAFFFEVKRSVGKDFLKDPPEPHSGHWRGHDVVKNASKPNEDLGQNFAYAAEIFARQFRLHIFSVSVSGASARLARWDRAGVIMSRAFSLRTEPEILCEFLWRFSHMTETQRGLDLTVEPASEEDETLFKTAIAKHAQYQLEGTRSGSSDHRLQLSVLEHYQPGAVSSVMVHSKDLDKSPPVYYEQRYLVSRPLISPLSVAGRATRTYWAVNPDTSEVVFLKDTWRFLVDGAEEEGEVLASLERANVQNVPKVLQYGHVPCVIDDDAFRVDPAVFQDTRTQDFLGETWCCNGVRDLRAIVKHTHYRIVLAVAGYSLARISGTSELLCATYDAFLAMLDAYQNAGRLHRDISVGSIILFRPPGHRHAQRIGYLIDWDLSWRIGTQDPHTVYPRYGTWQFASINTAGRQSEKHTIQDDMESMLYVLLYCSMRWLPHSRDDRSLRAIMDPLFDYSHEYLGHHEGGHHKTLNAMDREYTDRVQFKNRALHCFLNDLMYFHQPVPTWRVPSVPEPTQVWGDPERLEEFWRNFLNSPIPLPSDDRVHRVLSDEARAVRSASPQPATIPSMTSRSGSAVSVSRKRGRAETPPPSVLASTQDGDPRSFPPLGTMFRMLPESAGDPPDEGSEEPARKRRNLGRSPQREAGDPIYGRESLTSPGDAA
ncbi:hypothetical protein OH77DRAFT_1398442 [Trametes cingulata]|nr:hypothetical protein OH77DRAFT_1398442 [Trametes cingulata]